MYILYFVDVISVCFFLCKTDIMNKIYKKKTCLNFNQISIKVESVYIIISVGYDVSNNDSLPDFSNFSPLFC